LSSFIPALIDFGRELYVPWRLTQGDALFDLVAEHHQMILGHYGKALGMRVARKHLGWYLDAVSTPPGLRRAILTAEAPGPLMRALAEALAAGRPEVAA